MTTIEVAPGVDIAYARSGSGPALVLVHGITESRHSWDPLLPALTAEYDVVALDLRGHGDSSQVAPFDSATLADDVAGLVRGLGLDRPYLVGHSLGGVVVTLAATRVPVAGVVDVDQPLALAGFQAGLQPAAGLIRGTEEQFRGFVAAMFASMDGRLPAEERARVDATARPDQEVVNGVWELILDAPAAEVAAWVDAAVAGVDAPYLSLHGIDPGPDYPAWLAARIPSAVVEVWDGDGHYPHLVQPERFVQRLREFTAPAGA